MYYFNSKLKNSPIYAIFGTDAQLILLILLDIDLDRVIFKLSIGGQTWGSKKVKKRSINSNLENLPMDAFLLQIPI